MAGPYHYGQQTYGNTAESLLSGLAPDAQVALANTLLSTILQGQAPGSNPSYGMYQQSQSYQEMNYRDNRGYRNETVQRGQRYGVNRQGDRIGRRDDRNDRRGAPPRSGYLSGMDRKKGGRDQGFRNKAGNKGPKKPVTQSDKQQKDKKKVAKEPEKIDDKVNEEAEKDRAESPNEKTEEAEKKESDEEKMEEGETDVKKEELNEKEESEKLKDTTEYAGIPKEFLYCHVCEKHVWNGVSFLRHIRGNKHLSLVRRLEDVYEATVKSLRLISQLDEYRRIGMEGSKGVFKKKNRRPWKVTCDMCDVSFFGSIYAHRANHAHQTLKNFLHSSCDICKENFRMKINHDHHRLSAGHIKKLVEKSGGTAEHPDVIDEVLEELKFVPTEKAIDVEGLESGAPPVPKDTDFDINAIGCYDVNTPVGRSSVTRLASYFCNICNVNMKFDESLKSAHMESEEHLSELKKKEKVEGEEHPEETAEDMAGMDIVDEINEETGMDEDKEPEAEENEVGENEEKEEKQDEEEEQEGIEE